MFLSEAETEARLDDLRRQRAALDRAIAEHELYLDLGRRLARPGVADPVPAPVAEPDRAAPPHPDPVPPASRPVAAAPVPPAAPPRAEPAAEPRPAGGGAARREGRRLIEAAEEILAAAGRPMHAAEIWERLAARGLTLPGHDPVAALNTRLWKRAQGGSVFHRLGDGVYGLAP